MTPDQALAQTRARTQLAAAANPFMRELLVHAQHNAPEMMRDLDPRTPPEAVGLALSLVASDALALVMDASRGQETSADLVLLANTLAAYVEAFMRLSEQS